MVNNKIVTVPKNKKIGYVKHYRSIQEERIWEEGSALEWKLYCKLRDDANIEANNWIHEGKPYSCLPGELITSVQSLVDKLYSKRDKITPRKVRVALDNIVKYGNIRIETSWSTKIIFIDKKQWQWNPKLGGWILVNNEWVYIEPGEDEFKSYFEKYKQNIILQHSNNTIYDVKTYVTTFSDLLEAETPVNKGLPGFDDADMSKDMSRHLTTNKELIRTVQEEEEEGPTSSIGKEKEEATTSSDIQIIKHYYTVKKEYHHNGPAVNIDKDIAILKKCDNRTMIIDDGPVKADEKIRGWFHDSNDKNYEWKKGADFPFAAFCKQYHTIRKVERVKYFADTCRECGGTLHRYEGGGMEEHICSHVVICHHCNTGIPYKGKKRDEAILQEHRERAGCNAPES